MHERVRAVLQVSQIPFRLRLHREFTVPIRSPADFAKALGYASERVAKTILLRNQARSLFCLATLPAEYRLNFGAVAERARSGRLELASAEDLKQALDYPPLSVSPLGAGELAVFVDSKLTEFETVLVGAGAIGEELEIAPGDLISVASAAVAILAVAKT
jgi:Cys-tRNA(Pro)/Cys-tRNA(Cys) deacylase